MTLCAVSFEMPGGAGCLTGGGESWHEVYRVIVSAHFGNSAGARVSATIVSTARFKASAKKRAGIASRPSRCCLLAMRLRSDAPREAMHERGGVVGLNQRAVVVQIAVGERLRLEADDRQTEERSRCGARRAGQRNRR